MDLGLKDKLAVVTGASKGIGLAITRALVAEGACVIAGSRRGSPELGDLVDGGRVYAVAVDLSTTDGPQRLIDAAREWGQIDSAIMVSPRPSLRLREAIPRLSRRRRPRRRQRDASPNRAKSPISWCCSRVNAPQTPRAPTS